MTSMKHASEKAATVTLTGDLTIPRAAEILSLLKESIQSRDQIRVTLLEVSRVDLSFLQLLCSAYRTAAEAGKVLKLGEPVPDVLRQLIWQAGFKRREGCAYSLKTDCQCFVGGE